MKHQHRHHTKCPVACALDIVGDKWTLLIVRDLMFFNKHEFKEFLAAEEGISTNILSDRLKKLLNSQLINVIPHPECGTRRLYYLTAKGKSLIEMLTQLARWSAQQMEELVDIPDDKLIMLQDHPDHLIKAALEDLQQWEQQYGIH